MQRHGRCNWIASWSGRGNTTSRWLLFFSGSGDDGTTREVLFVDVPSHCCRMDATGLVPIAKSRYAVNQMVARSIKRG